MRVGTTLLASVFLLTLFALSTSAFEIGNSGRMRQVGPAIYDKSNLLTPNNNFVAEKRRKWWHYHRRLHYTIEQPFATSYSLSCNNNNRREVHLHLTVNDEDYSGKHAETVVVPKPTKYLPSIFLTTLMVFVNNKIMGDSGKFDHFLTEQNCDVWFSGWFTLLILTRFGCGNLMYGVVYPFFFSDDNDNCSDNIIIISNNNNKDKDSNKSKFSVLTRALEGLFSFGGFQFVIRYLYTTVLPSLERQSLPISVINTTTILQLLVYLVGTNVYCGRRNEIDPKAHKNWTLNIMIKKFPTGWKFISHCLKADGFCEGIENIQPSIVLAIFLTYSPYSFLNLGLYTVFVASRLYTTMIQKEEPITIDFWQLLITTLIGINLMECLAMLD